METSPDLFHYKFNAMKFKKFNGPRLAIDNVDIRSLLSSLGISFKEGGKNISNGWIGVQCPFCDDNSTHLGINLRAKTATCWKCGPHGTIVAYLAKVLNSFPKALEVIKEYIPRELQFEEEKERSGVSEVLLPPNAKPGLSKQHKIYLAKRRFNPEYLEDKYNLFHVGPVGKYKNRIIVPVLKHSQLLTFTTVDIHDDSPNRYIHLSEELSIMHVKELLYNEDNTDGHNIIVTEGLFDAWRIGDGCTPLFGVHFTAAQKRLLMKYPNLKAVGDGDKEGWEFNKRITAEMAPFCKCRYFDLDEGIDPDDLTEEEIKYVKNC